MYIYILDCVENAKKSWTYYIVPFSTKKYPISKLLETLEQTPKNGVDDSPISAPSLLLLLKMLMCL